MKKIYDQLDWKEIRRRYEVEGATITQICVDFKIKSRTTIERKIRGEGWIRQVEQIAAHMTTGSVAAAGRAEAQQDVRAARVEPPAAPPPSRITDKVGATAVEAFGIPDGLVAPKRGATSSATSKTTSQPDAIVAAAHDHVEAGSGGESGKDAPPRRKLSLEAAFRHIDPAEIPEDTDSALEVARGLSVLHSGAITRQMRLGREIQDIGMRVLRLIDLLVSSNDSGVATEAWRRLLAANPDKDTLNSVLKAAVAAVDQGVKIERLALAMDEVKPAGGGSSMEGVLPSADRTSLIAIVRSVDPDMALRLRGVVKEVEAVMHRGQAAVGAQIEGKAESVEASE